MDFNFIEADHALRTAEVARALGVSPRAIRAWADEGKIACYRTFGGHRLFTVAEVQRVLASWRQPASEGSGRNNPNDDKPRQTKAPTETGKTDPGTEEI
jgi:excisionase family DNA binding protein